MAQKSVFVFLGLVTLALLAFGAKNLPGSGSVERTYSKLLLDFNQVEYKKSLEDKKIIFLDFYANWCPICRGEEPILRQAYQELNDERVVGFRINYNDDQTDNFEKELAKQFGVTYQHTKVVLKDGKLVLFDPTVWTKEKFLEELRKATAT